MALYGMWWRTSGPATDCSTASGSRGGCTARAASRRRSGAWTTAGAATTGAALPVPLLPAHRHCPPWHPAPPDQVGDGGDALQGRDLLPRPGAGAAGQPADCGGRPTRTGSRATGAISSPPWSRAIGQCTPHTCPAISRRPITSTTSPTEWISFGKCWSSGLGLWLAYPLSNVLPKIIAN
jgi:hypothetical protein